MNPLCHYREFAIQRLSLQHKIERQSQTYLDVFAHKATDPLLKQVILDAHTEAKDRLKSLESLLLSMDVIAQLGYAESTNGIVYEGLQRLGVEPDPFSRDAIILQTLILLYDYKLANYRIIIDYFQALEQEYPLYVTQSLLENEKKILYQFRKLLTADVMSSSRETSPPPQSVRSGMHEQVVRDN